MKHTAGSYSTCNLNKLSLDGTNLTGQKKTNVKITEKEKPIHQIFADCAKLCTDSYWEHIFNECSYSRFPKGITYRDAQLCIKRNNKYVYCNVSQNIYDSVNQCIAFFKEYKGLMSDIDKNMLDLEHDKFEEEVEEQINSWSRVKKKEAKLLLDIYMDMLKAKYSLTNKELINLTHNINLGLILKIINKKTIIMENSRITEITSLYFDEDTRKFSLDFTIKPNITRNNKVKNDNDSTDIFFTKWREYLTQNKLIKPQYAVRKKEKRDRTSEDSDISTSRMTSRRTSFSESCVSESETIRLKPIIIKRRTRP